MKKLAILGLAFTIATTFLTVPVMADKTMDQIEKTGKIKLGFREGSIPRSANTWGFQWKWPANWQSIWGCVLARPLKSCPLP